MIQALKSLIPALISTLSFIGGIVEEKSPQMAMFVFLPIVCVLVGYMAYNQESRVA